MPFVLPAKGSRVAKTTNWQEKTAIPSSVENGKPDPQRDVKYQLYYLFSQDVELYENLCCWN